MTKLEELIEKLCPDGVEYKTLGEVATISRGGNFQKKDFTEQGKPCIHYGQIYTRYGLFTDKTLTFINDECFAKQKYAEPNDIIMAVTSENIEDICKCVAWLGSEKVAVSGHSAIIHHSLEPKYLTYFFHSQHFFNQKRKLAHGTKVMEVTPDTLKSIKFPVPPLEVQREIVRILDNFTFLTTELAAELAARQKQYEYYRDLLLTFKSNGGTILNERTNELELSSAIRWMKLGDLSITITKGTTPKTYSKSGICFIRTEAIESDLINFDKVKYIDYDIHNGSLRRSILQANDILFTIAGATIGKCVVVPASALPANTNQALAIIRLKENYEHKYIFYLLKSKYIKDYIQKSIKGSAQPNLNLQQLNDFVIPVPPLEVQQRIVDILDRFDTLCNDISSGLPAEIEMRQKQYEYYRDKLLTFKELKKEA
jgi:type I restriction enzyme S subunit